MGITNFSFQLAELLNLDLPNKKQAEVFSFGKVTQDRLCGLVIRVSGYRYRGLGFDSRRYQIF